MKILAVGLVLIAALAGAAYAMPYWMGGWSNMTQNWTMGSHHYNYSRANSTQVSAFWQAVASDDFQTASALHQAYGLGGPFFSRLNQTTFADYSALYNARAKLWSDLGLNPSSVPNRMHMRGFSRFHRMNSSVTEPK